MNRPYDNRAWLLVAPVFVIVAFSAIIPLMTVVNYSVQDVFDSQTRYFVGTEWFRQILTDPALQGALGRQFGFTAAVLAIEIPLGIGVALVMPREGLRASLTMIAIATPLLIPWNVVGTIWQVYARTDIGLMGWLLTQAGADFNYVADPVDAWLTVLLMDVWHWTPLVALLSYAGLLAIPRAYYAAAAIDGASRWAVFRYIEVPHLRGVLIIALLLRFMDSFMIYTEPFVLTGGGPGNSTTFLSQSLTKMAVGQFDVGPAAAFSIVYFLIILLVCWVFYTLITQMDGQ